MRANSPNPGTRIALALSTAVLLLLPMHSLRAEGRAKKAAKHRAAAKHEAAPRPAAHPAVHPEAQSARREAEAKKRRADDKRVEKRQEKKAKQAEVKRQKANPDSLHSKHGHRKTMAQQAVTTQHALPASRQPTTLATTQPSGPPPDKTGHPADADTAAAGRVHAWVHASAANDAALEAAGSPDVAVPESVVSVIRAAPDALRPQLPPVEELAAEPVILPALYTRRGRLVMPPPLKGSHEILLRQNQVANDEGLARVQDDDDLDRLRGEGALVAIRTGNALRVDDRLPLNRRYCRPWTALFLATLARQHFAQFGSAIQVNSAVRTVAFQQRLIHTNGNAAPAQGETASPHLTGQAIDIAKRGLSMAEIAWLRGYLLPLVQQGKVDVEEEFQQSCFHISVYKSYLPRAFARPNLATARSENLGALSIGSR